jgi:hypothetical protein
VIRHRLVLQQLHEVYTFSAGFLQRTVRIDPAQISVYQYLEHNPGVGRRFSSLEEYALYSSCSPVPQAVRLATVPGHFPVSTFHNSCHYQLTVTLVRLYWFCVLMFFIIQF